MKRMGVASVVLAVTALTIAGSAWAAPSTHFVKATKETKIVNGKSKKV